MNVRVQIPTGVSKSNQIIQSGLQQGIQRSTALVNLTAIQKAPRKTGTLKRSIHAEVQPGIGNFSGKVIQDTGVAKYGPFVEFGTGVYHEPSPNQAWSITPKNKKALFWKGANHPVRKVTINGMKAKSYMRAAFKESVKPIQDIMNEEIQKALREIGGN